MTFEEFVKQANTLMNQKYALSLADAGFDFDFLKSYWKDDFSPLEFVEAMGEKYNLEEA